LSGSGPEACVPGVCPLDSLTADRDEAEALHEVHARAQGGVPDALGPHPPPDLS